MWFTLLIEDITTKSQSDFRYTYNNKIGNKWAYLNEVIRYNRIQAEGMKMIWGRLQTNFDKAVEDRFTGSEWIT